MKKAMFSSEDDKTSLDIHSTSKSTKSGRVKSENIWLKKKVANLDQMTAEKTEEIDRLTHEIHLKCGLLEKKDHKIASLRKSTRQLNAQMKDKDSLIHRMTEEIQILKNKNQFVKSSVAQLKKKLRNKDEIDSIGYSKAYQKLEEKYHSICSERDEILKTLDSTIDQSQFSSDSDQILFTSEQMFKLERLVSKQQNIIEDMREMMILTHGNYQTDSDKITDLKESIRQLLIEKKESSEIFEKTLQKLRQFEQKKNELTVASQDKLSAATQTKDGTHDVKNCEHLRELIKLRLANAQNEKNKEFLLKENRNLKNSRDFTPNDSEFSRDELKRIVAKLVEERKCLEEKLNNLTSQATHAQNEFEKQRNVSKIVTDVSRIMMSDSTFEASVKTEKTSIHGTEESSQNIHKSSQSNKSQPVTLDPRLTSTKEIWDQIDYLLETTESHNASLDFDVISKRDSQIDFETAESRNAMKTSKGSTLSLTMSSHQIEAKKSDERTKESSNVSQTQTDSNSVLNESKSSHKYFKEFQKRYSKLENNFTKTQQENVRIQSDLRLSQAENKLLSDELTKLQTQMKKNDVERRSLQTQLSKVQTILDMNITPTTSTEFDTKSSRHIHTT